MVILNSIKCKLCGDIIISHHNHDYISCSCGGVFTDGGRGYIRSGAKDPGMIIDKSIIVDDIKTFMDDIEMYHAYVYWGTYGKSGREDLSWIKIADMSTDHILAIIFDHSELLPIIELSLYYVLGYRGVGFCIGGIDFYPENT